MYNHVTRLKTMVAQDYKRKVQTSSTNCLKLNGSSALWSRNRKCARYRMSPMSNCKWCIVPRTSYNRLPNGIYNCLVFTGSLHGLAEQHTAMVREKIRKLHSYNIINTDLTCLVTEARDGAKDEWTFLHLRNFHILKNRVQTLCLQICNSCKNTKFTIVTHQHINFTLLSTM